MTFIPINFFLTVIAIIIASIVAGQSRQDVIFDTDMGPDYDDVGAIAVLHALEDSGLVRVRATIASTRYENVGAVLEVLNTYFRKPDIPIGIPRYNARNIKDPQHWTDTLLTAYPHKKQQNWEYTDAVTLYRKILSAAADTSITIITVGFFSNIANLLQSKPDKYTALSGAELVNKKVKKLVSMAGKFPTGREFNIYQDAKAAKYVIDHWQRPIIFSGNEIGAEIKSGLPLIRNSAIKNSPIKDVYRICIPMAKEDSLGRMSWDQTAVITAVIGSDPYFSMRKGRMTLDLEGNNGWQPEGHHYYLIQKNSVYKVQKLINDLMMHQPLQ